MTVKLIVVSSWLYCYPGIFWFVCFLTDVLRNLFL